MATKTTRYELRIVKVKGVYESDPDFGKVTMPVHILPYLDTMSDAMNQCINPDQSLTELYRLQSSYKRSLKMGKLLNRDKIVMDAIKASLKEVDDKIKIVEDIGFNGNGIIRIM